MASAIDANIVFGIYILAQACIPVCCRKAFAGGADRDAILKRANFRTPYKAGIQGRFTGDCH